jgi:hypothetical protein
MSTIDYGVWAADLTTKARARSYEDALRDVNAELAEFEERHGFASDELHAAIKSGRMNQHDDDACTWGILIQKRDRLRKHIGTK